MRFKDVFSIIGPSMVGPSSSHTAGAVRLGRVSRQLLRKLPERAEIVFYGSFAETYQGHGTDVAVVAGLLDYETDDPRIPDAVEEAGRLGVEIVFKISKAQVAHPNTAKITLVGGERKVTVIGASIGGGNIEIQHVNDFDVRFTGVYPALLVAHEDRKGMLADITRLLSDADMNIGYMDVDRKARHGEALTVLEVDNPIPDTIIRALRQLPSVREVDKVDLTEGGASAQ